MSLATSYTVESPSLAPQALVPSPPNGNLAMTLISRLKTRSFRFLLGLWSVGCLLLALAAPAQAAAPTFVSAETSNDGMRIFVTWSQDFNYSASGIEFTVKVNGSSAGYSVSSATRAVGRTVILYLPQAIVGGATVTLDYAGGTVSDYESGEPAASFANKSVTNNAPLPDTTPPTVASVVLVGTPAAGATSVSFTVTFSEPVTGVDAGDFTLTKTGDATGVVTVSGSGAMYTVTVNSITGNGTLKLDVKNSGTGIADAASNPLSGGYIGGPTHTVTQMPTLTSVSPNAGPTAGGTTVIITGTGFSAANPTGAVKFGTTNATYSINSNTQITATSPANAAGTYDVTVTTPGGTSATSASDQYTYVAPPVSSAFTAPPVVYNATGATFSVAGHATNAPTSHAVGSATTAQGGSVSINAAGLVTYSAPIGFRGNDSFTFTASNAGGTSTPATVTVPVSNPVLSSTLIGNGTRGVALSGLQISTSGGRAPYSCSTALATGALPAGTQLNADCTISGTPGASGTFNFTATVTDSSLGTGPFTQVTGALSLTIAGPVLTLSPAAGALPGGTAGVAYSQSFTAGGGTAAYSYARTAGTLPPGLTLSGGTLSGTPTAAGIFNFDITATDSSSPGSGGPYTRPQSYSVTVAQGSQAITFNPLPDASLSASPLTLSATASSGLTVGFASTTTGVCSVAGTSVTLLQTGSCSITASQAGDATWSSATDVVQSFTVTPANLAISSGAASGLIVGGSYSQSNTATGGIAPYTYALQAGAFAPGTSLDASTGLVSGTPTTAGSFSYQLRVSDSQAPSVMAAGAIVNVTIAKGQQTLAFTSTPPGPAQVGGASYSVVATASSGLDPTLSLDGGSSGCTLSGGAVTFTGVGTCLINANQTGDTNWNAAAQIQQSIAIGAADRIVASIDFQPGSIGVGAAGQVTITFTNPNASSSPAFDAVLTSPSLVTRMAGASGGSCSIGSESAPTSSTVQFGNIVVPPGSCTITLGYSGAVTGSTSGFVLDGFTPSGYTATPSTSGNGFAVVPTVTAISPNAGPVSQMVTVSGTGFSTTPGNNTVTFGSAGNGTVTAASATSLTVTTPGIGSGPVTVTVAVNGQTSIGNVIYTFIDKPVAADKTGVAVPYGSTGMAIDLSDSITGMYHSIAVGTAAAHGTTSVAGNVVTYTPTTGYFGTDSFTYTATGVGGTSNVATVSLTVTTPAAPVAADRSGVAVPYGSSGKAIDLSASISGVHTSLAVAVGPTHGTVSVTGNVVTYTPTAGYAGADSFTWTATGPGGTSAPARVSVTVAQGAQVITFANPGAQAFGTTPTLAASVDSGLPLRFVSSTPAVCAVTSAGVLGFASAGTCTVTVHQDGDASHKAASLTQSFSVTALAPAAPVPGEVTVVGSGEVEVHFTPSPATGETITYTVTAQPGGITATGTGSPITVRGLTDGVSYTFTVAASGQAGGGSTPSAPSAPVVPQVLQTVIFEEIGPRRFDQVPVLSARADSGLPVTFASQTQDVCTVTTEGQLAFVQAGSCTLVVAQAGDATHRPASATRTFRIEPVPPGVPAIQTLTPVAPGQVSVAFTPPVSTGGAHIDGYRVTATPQASAAPAARTMSLRAAATPGVVTATGSGSPILVQGLADGVSYVFTVAAYNLAGEGEPDSATELVAAPSLSWIGDLQKMYGQADFELPLPQSTSPGAFTFASSNPAVATVSGRTVTLVGEGSTTLTATQAATPNYLTGMVAVTLVVSPRPDPTLDAQVSGGIQAQADASVRFAQVQGDNIRDRLRQVRSGHNASNVNLALAYAGSQGVPGLTMPVGRVAEAALPTLPEGWGLWLAGTATFGKTGRNGRAGGGFDFNTGGLTLGADRAVGENVLLGLAGSWGRQGTDFDGTPSKVDADQRSLAVYGLWRMGEHLFVDGLLANGQLDFDLVRWSELANTSAHATRAGEQWFGALTFGYEHRSASGLSLTGYGRYDGHRATLDGYRERGLEAYDLVYGRQRVGNSALAVGLEGSLAFKGERLSWRPHWRIEYRGALENRGDVSVNYVQRPRDADYVLAMRSYNDDMLSIGAGMDLQLDSGWMFSLLLGREQGRNAMRSTSIGLQVRYGQQGTQAPMYGENGDAFNVDMTGDTRRCRGAAQPCATRGNAMGGIRP